MTPEEIKTYCEERLERSNRLIPSERTSSYYDEQLRLRELWLQAEQAESLATIAECLNTDRTPGRLEDIATAIEALNPGR